jgi:hypothetical protein
MEIVTRSMKKLIRITIAVIVTAIIITPMMERFKIVRIAS